MKKIGLVAACIALAGCGMMKDKMPGGGSTGSGISKPDMPAGTTCDDDKGVEAAGKEMDAKAYEGLLASHSALASMYDAAGKKPDADKTRAEIKAWKDDKA